MIPINRLLRWPFPGSIPPDTASLDVEMVTDDEALSVLNALTNALGTASGAMVFELLQHLAVDAAAKLGGGIPCISFKDGKAEFASIIMDDDEFEEGEDAEPRPADEWESGSGEEG
jgi:hypothetical protein